MVYPLARGSAPVFVLLVSGARSPLQVAGVLLVAIGTVLVRGIARRGQWFDVLGGLMLGACIASYTLVDQRGVRLANPLAYLEAVLVIPALLYAGFIIWRASPRVAIKTIRPLPVIAGVLMFLAYAFTLTALQMAPASAVSAVRETSVVITVVLAAPLLHEAVGAMRVTGAAVVAAGVAAVALG